MKRNSFLNMLFFGGLLIAVLSGCKKDTGANDYLRGKVDGVSFECNSKIWATPSGAGDKTIVFKGYWATDSIISFNLDGDGSNITTGIYDFQVGKKYRASLYEYGTWYGAGYSCEFFGPCSLWGSGKITITDISKKSIRGTFEFTASHPAGGLKTVSGGEFYIHREKN